ncbi:MAG: ABC transporter substrate-binding protein, partial [Acutalibacteraceae bacterium]
VGGNISGTSDLAPLDEQAAMFAELLPEAKTIGILYCSGEANSKYQVKIVTEELQNAGCTVNDYPFADSNDIAAVVTKATQECDALYIPTDNTAANNTELINNITEPAGIPIIAGEEGICAGCGVATFSPSYYDIGYQAGEMAYEILVNGTNPGDIEIGYCKDLVKEYVEDRAEKLGITIPDTYTAIEAD